ncbi:MAG: coenzyme F420-0:L-glutamate ligase [Candidatus Pacebacteria bacterium]|nr:coenzyme F420-0:L-glutamate ligase [Candidatus Paceibacterota bacterium]
MVKPESIALYVIKNIPLIRAGDNLGVIIANCIQKQDMLILDRDILVIAQKVVSRAENRMVLLSKVIPSQEANYLASKTRRDPRLCQLILDHSRVLYCNDKAIITQDRLGIVSTSAGIDRSNSDSPEGEIAILLPENPDLSARRVRDKIKEIMDVNVAVIISDSLGRPWREGSVGMAIGLAGIKAIEATEKRDLSGRVIHPEIALVDRVAAAASILMGEADEGYPVIIVRGINYTPSDTVKIRDLLRPAEEDQVWE